MYNDFVQKLFINCCKQRTSSPLSQIQRFRTSSETRVANYNYKKDSQCPGTILHKDVVHTSIISGFILLVFFFKLLQSFVTWYTLLRVQKHYQKLIAHIYFHFKYIFRIKQLVYQLSLVTDTFSN